MKILLLAFLTSGLAHASTIGIDRSAVFKGWLNSDKHRIVFGSVSIEGEMSGAASGRPHYGQPIVLTLDSEFRDCTASDKVDLVRPTIVSSFIVDRFGLGESYGVTLDSVGENLGPQELAKRITGQLGRDAVAARDVSFDRANWRLRRPTMIDPAVTIANGSTAFFIVSTTKGGLMKTDGVMSESAFNELCSQIGN